MAIAATVSAQTVGLSFADRIRALSEPERAFDTDNLITNEGSYLQVIPAIIGAGVAGGAYVGVGPDQNFSYIARIRPAVAYIIDIRRDNALLHLLFKALFAESPTRMEYLALLTGRAPPEPLDSWRDRSLEDMIEVLGRSPRASIPALWARIERRLDETRVPLDAADRETIARFHGAFIAGGFELRFNSHGRPPSPYYPNFRELLLADDAQGRRWNYLADEADYRFLRELQARDGIVPVVGDVSGARAMNAIGAELAAEGQVLSALYVSNVENYLFQDGRFEQFVRNLAGLPRSPRALVIRSVFRGGPSVSQVQGVDELLTGVTTGTIATYGDLIRGGQRER